MNISERIKIFRERKGFTQQQIADKLGIERPNYSRLEKRGDKLTIEQLKDITNALGVTLKELLFDEQSTDIERELEFSKHRLDALEKENKIYKELYEIFKTKVEDYERVKRVNTFENSFIQSLMKESNHDSNLLDESYQNMVKSLQNDHKNKEMLAEMVLGLTMAYNTLKEWFTQRDEISKLTP
jgi:transcriptional regulator with XRE-family HTH domain